MEYMIHEANMERLEKKLKTIKNKCDKYNCPFIYRVINEEFVETEEGVVKYFRINVTGEAKMNDWIFVATVEFWPTGNVIRKTGNVEVEVPERYYTSEPICEHCNTKKNRKSAYIVMNTVTGEFKQVGKSCLKDFTCGLSAEMVAQYIAMFDCLITGEQPWEGAHICYYYNTKEFLQFAIECVDRFGYFKSDDTYSTKTRAMNYYDVTERRSYLTKKQVECYTEEMQKVNFDHKKHVAKAEAILKWIAEVEETNNYIHNLKTICAEEYIENGFGFVASAVVAYNKAMEIEVKKAAKKELNAKSEYIGEVGQKITVEMKAVECVTSWMTQYGVTFIYKMTDASDNVYIWKTGKVLECEQCTVSGTIKAHNEFNGTKQTELTRCKVA